MLSVGKIPEKLISPPLTGGSPGPKMRLPPAKAFPRGWGEAFRSSHKLAPSMDRVQPKKGKVPQPLAWQHGKFNHLPNRNVDSRCSRLTRSQ